MQKRILWALALAALLTGCGGGNGEKPAPSQTPGGVPESGGTLKIYSYAPDTFNPLFTRNNANAQMLRLIYDTLVQSDDSARTVPALAADYLLSPDGLTWSLTLREGVSFHDGSPLTAGDVKASLTAARSAKSPYSASLENVSDITAEGNSVHVRLRAPQTNLISLLEIPVVKGADASRTENFHPNGTGRFVFSEKTYKMIYLSANHSWWGQTPPYLSGVEVFLLPDKATSVSSFEARVIDVVTTDLLGWGRFSASSEREVIEYSSGRFTFLAVHPGHPLLSDVRVRRGMAHAINKERIYEELLLSHAQIAQTCINPKWWMHTGDTEQYDYNPPKAAELFGQSEPAAHGAPLRLLVNNDNELKLRTAEQIRAQLTEAGLGVSVVPLPWDEFQAAVSSGAYDLYLGTINYSPEINPAYVIGSHPDFAGLLEQLQQQTNDTGRAAIYHLIQEQYALLLPSIPLYFETEAMLTNTHLGDRVLPVRGNMFSNVQEWHLSANAPKEAKK